MSRRGAPLRGAAAVCLLLAGLSVTSAITARADGRVTASTAPLKTATHRGSLARTSPSGEGCLHAVRRGESLSGIATRYRVTPSALASANRLATSDVLRVGQRLRLIGCRSAREPRAPAQQVLAVAPDGTSLTARVGPLRIPTRLFLAVPELDDTGVDFQWPVDGSVASNFGRRRGGWHAGIDIWADLGAPIRAAAPGEVIVSGWEPSYGHRIKIRHAGGFTSVYAHNLENVVTVGDSVAQGAVIGSVGSSGRATSPHLHFEIRRDDVAYNPLHFLEAGWASSVSEAVGASLDDDPYHD